MHAAVESLRETAIQVRTVAHEPTGVRPYVTNRPELSVNRGIWLGSATETGHLRSSISATRTPGIQSLTSLTWCSASVISGGASSKSPRGRARIFSQKGQCAPRVPRKRAARSCAQTVSLGGAIVAALLCTLSHRMDIVVRASLSCWYDDPGRRRSESTDLVVNGVHGFQ